MKKIIWFFCVAAVMACGGCAPLARAPQPGGPEPAAENTSWWTVPTDPEARIRDAGLPISTDEGSGEHFHAHLDVYYDGEHIAVPAFVGYVKGSGDDPDRWSPVHTHDDSSVIHIEAEKAGVTYTLGQFLREWGVFAGTGTVAGRPSGEWTVYVQGKPLDSGVDAVRLSTGEEIALVHGPAPASIPNHYDFPPNL